MSSIKCPNCGGELSSDAGISLGDICPFCLSPLDVSKEKPSFGVTTLGDANAISGGIHNTQITNNYVQENKDPELVKIENRKKFRDLVKQIIKPGGRLSQEGKDSLEDSRYQLGIDAVTANSIIEEVKKVAIKMAVSTLSTLDRIYLKRAKMVVSDNGGDIGYALTNIEPIAESGNNEEVVFYYNLLLAAKDSKRCIQKYQERKSDSYWQTFWASMAYMKEGDVSGARFTLNALKKWPEMPDYNQFLLGAAEDYNERSGNSEFMEDASLYLNSEEVEYSALLTDFKSAISALYSGTPDKGNFYLEKFNFKISEIAQPQVEEEKCVVNNTFIVGRYGQQRDEILDKTVSRQHCRVTLLADGMVEIENLSKSNGTSVDGTKIEKTKVSMDSVLKMGNYCIQIRDLFPPRENPSTLDNQRTQSQDTK